MKTTGFGYRGLSLIPNIPTEQELVTLRHFKACLAHLDAMTIAVTDNRAFSYLPEGTVSQYI